MNVLEVKLNNLNECEFTFTYTFSLLSVIEKNNICMKVNI